MLKNQEIREDGCVGGSHLTVNEELSSLLHSNIKADAFSAIAMDANWQTDKLTGQDVIESLLTLPHEQLEYKLMQTEGEYMSVLQMLDEKMVTAAKLAFQVKATTLALEIKNYKVPNVKLSGWQDITKQMNVNGNVLFAQEIENSCFRFHITIMSEMRRGNGYVADYTLAANTTNFPKAMQKKPLETLEMLKNPAQFTEWDKALQYAQRKMSKIEKELFTEDVPIIPAKYANTFMCMGICLPGYRYHL